VTRIVAGIAGGRRLAVPPGQGTRPTSDRAREALFSTLEALTDLDGSRVLDLYAGSGAVGLEALSRGAAHALLVEADARVARLIRDNARALGLTGAEVITERVQRLVSGPPPGPSSGAPHRTSSGGPPGLSSGALPEAPTGVPGAPYDRVYADTGSREWTASTPLVPGAPYDVVYADPPYRLPDADLNAVLADLAGNGWLAPGAVVVVERHRAAAEPVWPAPLKSAKQKRYGDTALWYGHAT